MLVKYQKYYRTFRDINKYIERCSESGKESIITLTKFIVTRKFMDIILEMAAVRKYSNGCF